MGQYGLRKGKGKYEDIGGLLEQHSKEMKDLLSPNRPFLDTGKGYQELQTKRNMHELVAAFSTQRYGNSP